MKQTILVVDDETDNVEALERLFRRDYEVLKATSGDEGLVKIKGIDVALIISDQRMPGLSGVEFLKKTIDTHPETIRILLTGYTDIDSIIGAINSGEVYRYMNKPWDPVDLKNTVDKAIEKFELRRNLKSKNDELKLALNELRNLDEAKNHFMVLINHELKTPLTVMLSFLELLQESQLDEEQQMYSKRIEKSAFKINKIIEDVLELISAETGLLKLSKKKIKCEKLSDSLLPESLAQAEKNEQKLQLDWDGSFIKADSKVISSVFNRVVENAIKFGDKKTKIVIESKKINETDVRIAVTNQGPALSAVKIQKILKPFSLDEDIMNHTEGLGLGLSLCQALLKHHGSGLEIKSSKKSVTVSFTLPMS